MSRWRVSRGNVTRTWGSEVTTSPSNARKAPYIVYIGIPEKVQSADAGARATVIRVHPANPCKISPALIGVFFVLATASCEIHRSVDASAYQQVGGGGGHDTTPVRNASATVAPGETGNDANCASCHHSGMAPHAAAATETGHADIQVDHGLTLHCADCHDPTDPAHYTHHDGSRIEATATNQLCAKCHELQYRDYTLAVHGRINGYWNAALGDQRMLDCIHCHDPHRPEFAPVEPDPPPNLARFARNAGDRIDVH